MGKAQDNWRHGAIQGHVAMARRNFLNALRAPTVTDETKEALAAIIPQLDALSRLLREKKQ